MQKLDIYKCRICGNIVSVYHVGNPALRCCGEKMIYVKENTEDAAVEKHIPVIEVKDNKVLVKVGSTLHPMEEKHYIEWIEVIIDDELYVKFLKPNDQPIAEFTVNNPKNITVREYCNLHGLWKAQA